MAEESQAPNPSSDRMPRWVWKASLVFWLGFLATILFRYAYSRLSSLLVIGLVSLFLSLAIEPGVAKLARRGWRRGRATMLILLGLLVGVVIFIAAIGTLVATQVADLAQNSDRYVNRTVEFLNDNFGADIDARRGRRRAPR